MSSTKTLTTVLIYSLNKGLFSIYQNSFARGQTHRLTHGFGMRTWLTVVILKLDTIAQVLMHILFIYLICLTTMGKVSTKAKSL